jgi:tRNA threonylcarbamoyladenosine biosynthesis protein TsaB
MEGLDMVLNAAGLEAADLDMVACMRGPGSFTGLRIGFSVAQGLSLALGIPMVSAPTLDCMALPCSAWPGIVVPVIDAKKHRYFTALFKGNRRISDYMDAEIAEITSKIPPHERILLTGPGADMAEPEFARIFPGNGVFIDPAHGRGKSRELLEIAGKNTILNKGSSFPLYLRKSDAELQ